MDDERQFADEIINQSDKSKSLEEICVWKLVSEENKRIGAGIYSDPEHNNCDGYNFDCIRYFKKPRWYGRD